MLDAVIIILREVLEAALIISLLLASSFTRDINRAWVFLALFFGASGALAYAYFMADISDSFDGVGQEVFNGCLLLSIIFFLALHNVGVSGQFDHSNKKLLLFLTYISFLGAVGVAIVHEGAEIFVYIYGHSSSVETLQPILLGGSLGFGIGLSIGALFYYALVNISKRFRMPAVCCIILIVAAGAASQSALFLIQADLLPSQLPLWNSSEVIPEQSVVGQLLYALFSYEATPTPLQAMFYVGALLVMASAMTVAAVISQKHVIDSEQRNIPL